MSRQEAFISEVREALGNPGQMERRRRAIFAPVDPAGRKALLDLIRERSSAQRMQLLEILTKRAAPLNIQVVPVNGAGPAAAAISRLVDEKQPEWGGNKSVVAWQHPLIEELKLPDALAAQQTPVHFPEANPNKVDSAAGELRTRVVESFVGITAADYCLAESATLVITVGPGQARSISLVPSIHVAVITLDQIIADLAELYALLKHAPDDRPKHLTNCLTFITGPSKTADIELNMVHGAHGPRELHLVVLIP